MKKQTVLRKLAELKTPLLQYGVTKLGLFGSTVRGENKPGSDIDVLIDFQPEGNLPKLHERVRFARKLL